MGEPRFVRDAVIRPMRCAHIAYVGTSREPHGFFDFGTELGGEHVYTSWTAFLEMAKIARFGPLAVAPSDEVAQLRAQLEEAQATIAGQESILDAVDTLKRGGFEPKRRPGRPKNPAKLEEAVV